MSHSFNSSWKIKTDMRSTLDDEAQGDFSALEAVLREIHQHWSFMLQDNFDPVSFSLKLMDDSSIGRNKDYPSFQNVLHDLDEALKTIVNDYYKGFNNSIGTFGGVLQYINDSSSRVVQMKSNLKKCKEDLLEKRNDLLNLWYKSQQYKEMLRILEVMEDLRTTPEKVENMIESKQVLAASHLLVTSIKTISSEEMTQIGALDDVRRTLLAQKNTLYDLLVQELHTHLYLKNVFCDNRWAPYTHRQKDLPEIPIKPRVFKEMEEDGEKDMFTNENDIITEDADKDPDTDSYYYMEIIMESLSVLGEIPPTLQTIQERLPIELHKLIEKTISEVEQRHVKKNWASRMTKGEKGHDDTDMYCLDKANSEEKNEILKDLLWTLYSKLEAVLRGHRFIETCSKRIKKRLLSTTTNSVDQASASAIKVYHFHEIWRPVQSEVRAILKEYLTSQEQSIVSVDEPSLKKGFQEKREQDMFSFSKVPQDSWIEDSYGPLRERLLSHYKKQVPSFSEDTHTMIDKYAHTISSKGYKVLVKPDAYNVSVLLSPTMAFLNRIKEVFPNYDDNNEEGFGSFLDDFAVNVFLPQIEEKVMQLIQHATAGMDSFQDVRDYKSYSRYPIAKSAVALISIVQSLCRTMHSMPFHTDEYIRLIEVVLLKFYEKCYQRFYSTVARGSAYTNEQQNVTNVTISTSGDWAQDEKLVSLLTQNPYFMEESASDAAVDNDLHQTEIKRELELKTDRLLDPNEMMFDTKKFVALGRLYHTLRWFVREIWELRSSRLPNTEKIEIASDSPHPRKDSKRWSSEIHRTTKEGEQEPTFTMLPLRGDIATRFDALLTTYQQLAETCLFTLRLEGRCHTMYYLELAIRNGNYCLEDESFEPDPCVITLNTDLMELNDCVNACLPSHDELFIFDGLPQLIAYLLIHETSYIKKLNQNGIQKMNRNVLALQQNLSNFVSLSQCKVMESVRDFYQLYHLGSEGMIKSIRETGPKFGFEEYLSMLRLIHGVNANGEENEPGSSKSENGSNFTEWFTKLDEVLAEFEN
ncbi:Sec8 exocyst complex component-specific domain-containing protein [Sporodiniella umbellata]|nr:Sec8 exocyst complex component-specific domain-containing protein [Sporodiniella umbellata]